MKFLMILSMAFVMMFSFSCTNQTKQVTADMVSGALSSSVITALSCENGDLVRKDIGNQVQTWFGLPQNKGIAGEVCKLAVNAVIPMIFTGTTLMVKPEWKCTGKASSDLVTKLASMACSTIPL
jgi:hypothetical protein